jgi:hypothetical protein
MVNNQHLPEKGFEGVQVVAEGLAWQQEEAKQVRQAARREQLQEDPPQRGGGSVGDCSYDARDWQCSNKPSLEVPGRNACANSENQHLQGRM